MDCSINLIWPCLVSVSYLEYHSKPQTFKVSVIVTLESALIAHLTSNINGIFPINHFNHSINDSLFTGYILGISSSALDKTLKFMTLLTQTLTISLIERLVDIWI